MTALEALNMAAPLADTYSEVEQRLLVAIARQLTLNDTHDLNEVSKWQIKQLAQLGMLKKNAAKIINAMTKDVPDNYAANIQAAIEATLAEDGLNSMWENEEFSESAKKAVKHYRNQAADVYNQVNTVMQYKAGSSYVKAVNSVAEKMSEEMRRMQPQIANKQALLDTLNSNAAAVASGSTARTRAVRGTIHEMAKKGIPAFVDKRGREWSPEAYVNMDIRNTVKNTATDAAFGAMDALGQDVFEVSSHPGSRPKCRPWQGKFISKSGRTTEITDLNGRKYKVYPLSQTSYGEPDGLFGINCGHRPRGVSDGLFTRTAKTSEEYGADDEELYYKVCKQRELERKVRKSKTEADMLDAAGDAEGARAVRQKAAQYNKKLKTYCQQNGLKYRTDRVRTYGSVKPAEKASAAVPVVEKPVKPVFVPAKTIEEAQTYALSIGIRHVDYSDLPLETANLMNEAALTLPKDIRPAFLGSSNNIQNYSGVKFQRTSKHFYGVKVEVMDMHFGEYPNVVYDFDGGHMVGVSSYYKTAEKISKAKVDGNKRYAAKYDGHTQFFNTDGKSTAFHEMGHVYADKKGIPDGFADDAKRWYSESNCDMLKSTDEAWAEAWGAYHTRNQELPDYIARYIEKATEIPLDKSAGSGIIKSLDIDDFELLAHGRVSAEATEIITSVIKRYEKERKIYINDCYFGSLPSNGDGVPLLQIQPIGDKNIRLNVNTDIFSGRTVDEINEMLAKTVSNVANTLEEAVIHECGHARLIKGLSIKEIENLYDDIANAKIEGVSVIAYNDGAEAIAEIEVLLERGDKIPQKALDFYNKHIRRDNL